LQPGSAVPALVRVGRVRRPGRPHPHVLVPRARRRTPPTQGAGVTGDLPPAPREVPSSGHSRRGALVHDLRPLAGAPLLPGHPADIPLVRDAAVPMPATVQHAALLVFGLSSEDCALDAVQPWSPPNSPGAPADLARSAKQRSRATGHSVDLNE